MNFKQLCTDMIRASNPAKAEKMASIMRGQFRFLGLDARTRRKVCMNQFTEAKRDTEIDWDFVDSCWDQYIREFQYIAADYLIHQRNLLGVEDFTRIKHLIETKPWWDTGDLLQKLVNFLSAKFPELEQEVIRWSLHKDPWLKRVALQHQIGRGPYTNREILEEIILNCSKSTDPFVKRAIGRSLRDLRNSHPEWVDAFLEAQQKVLPAMSVKEAMKD